MFHLVTIQGLITCVTGQVTCVTEHCLTFFDRFLSDLSDFSKNFGEIVSSILC